MQHCLQEHESEVFKEAVQLVFPCPSITVILLFLSLIPDCSLFQTLNVVSHARPTSYTIVKVAGQV